MKYLATPVTAIALFVLAVVGITLSQEDSPPAVAETTEPGKVYAFTLETALHNGFAFIGVGGDIDGVVNPQLHVPEGATVELTLVNGDGMEHDWAIEALGIYSEHIVQRGESTVVTFVADKSGTFEYLCTVPGHKQAGMYGTFVVGETSEATDAEREVVSVAKNPADLPGPLTHREPIIHDLELTTTEIEAHLADGATYTFWTFNDTVPGPFLRVRVGDTVNVTLHNDESSRYVHSIDFHAVTGPGGGAAVTQTAPGETTRFSFKALNPGLYVYHCATHSHAHHIASGMYGLILVEPEEGLPEVDHEFYVMQGELYTAEAFGSQGYHTHDHQKLLDERAEYLFFNGATDALTTQYPMQANVGETVRLFFGVGGPNYTSSFHVIGEIFDRVYVEGGSMINENVQTTLVPAGGATILEFTVEVPGRLILVDHSLARLERGLVGFLDVEGPENPEVFNAGDHVQEAHGH
jgi:nitrite reductase (NO-forming)